MAILVLLNNFTHDFSAAGWLFCTVLLWVMLRKKEAADVITSAAGAAGETLTNLIKTILLLMRLSLGGIIVFGIIRALAYKEYEWNAAAGDGQVVLLIVKHIILTAVFVLGIVYYRRAAKLIKNKKTG